MEEAITYDYVIRDGKKIRKPSTDRENYKIVYDDHDKPREAKITPSEAITRKKAGKITARKSKSKQSSASRKRAKSSAKRTWECVELNEAFFKLDHKNCVKYLYSLAKKYNTSYKMLKIVDNNRDGFIDLIILYPNNKVGKIVFDVQEGYVDIISNNDRSIIPFKQYQFIKIPEFLKTIEKACEFCHNKIFKNDSNLLAARDYSKVRFV